MENFSGRSVLALKQDVLAKVLTLNLTAILASLAQWMTKRLYQQRRHDYQVNFANALSKMKDNVVRLLGADPPPELLPHLVCAMARNHSVRKAQQIRANDARNCCAAAPP